MGKNQHSKDRLFITATEWATQYGGKKRKSGSEIRPLPFDHCALSLAPYSVPVMLSNNTGVVFDFENIVPYIQKYHCDPVTGEEMTSKDIIRLNMDKNTEGEWQCPITNKVFTASTHIVAIKTTGNVYSFSAVEELNLRPKNFIDLIDGSKFVRGDIITIQDPQNPDIMAKRDINSFQHLEQVRAENHDLKKSESKLRHSLASQAVMDEIERVQNSESEGGSGRKLTSDILCRREFETAEDVSRFLAMSPSIQDVNPGQAITDGKAGMSLTSTVADSHTSNASRLASPEEIRDARWRILRKLGKKAYVQLQTNMGNINAEVHCDMVPRTAWNFVTLCKNNYYNGTKFHRLIPGFVLQGGDPTATGTGGESAFGKVPFRDEFDSRLLHHGRGVISMANSGPNSNGSQFFITFKEAKHLDNKHSVFARVVGGLAILDKIEKLGADKRDRPLEEIQIEQISVFSDPLEEADALLEEFIRRNIENRSSTVSGTPLPAGTDEVEPPPAKIRKTI